MQIKTGITPIFRQSGPTRRGQVNGSGGSTTRACTPGSVNEHPSKQRPNTTINEMRVHPPGPSRTARNYTQGGSLGACTLS